MIEVVPEEILAMEENTDFCKVTAFIRCEVLEKAERRLQELGVLGISVTSVKGCGEYTNFYSHEGMTTHARVEIFTSAKRAEAIAQAIMDTACSGQVGDGIVAVLPVNKVYRIRHRMEVRPDEL
jgi:nitrogen regulatory protein P-II 1